MSTSAMRHSAARAPAAFVLLVLLGQLSSCLSATRTRSTRELEVDGQAPRPPRLFFLFMANGGLPNIEIWTHFFSEAKQGVDFEAYLHCQDRQRCEQAHPGLEHTFHLVDTVKSKWCEDLVSPMNALLSAALDGSRRQTDVGHPNDKFIFLSDTTVPLKPFSFVKHKLTVQDGRKSNFCIQEWPKWAFYQADHVLAKHSQWLILSRAHALNALRIAENYTPKQMMREMVPLRWAGSDWLAPAFWEVRRSVANHTNSTLLDEFFTFLTPAVRGCADEFWHLAATVGALDPKKAEQGVYFDDLGGGVLTMKHESATHLQGHCDTFALIDISQSEMTQGNGTRFGGQAGFLRPHIHAGKFMRLSAVTLRTLGSSKYLFARKMDNTTKFLGPMSLVEAFDRIIFKQH